MDTKGMYYEKLRDENPTTAPVIIIKTGKEKRRERRQKERKHNRF